MVIAAVGFENYAELDAALNDFIERKQIFLFEILCGGFDDKGFNSVAEVWARNNGAPVRFVFDSDVDRLLEKISNSADYLIVKSPVSNFARRLIMLMRSKEKHGEVL